MKDKIFGYSIFFAALATLCAWGFFTIVGIVGFGNDKDLFLNISEQWTIILIFIPIAAGVLVVLSIAAWIGWTMARTPPPAPIDLEDFESEETEDTKTKE